MKGRGGANINSVQKNSGTSEAAVEATSPEANGEDTKSKRKIEKDKSENSSDSKNNSSSDEMQSKTPTTPDLSGRRLSSRQRKPSWRVGFDPSELLEQNKKSSSAVSAEKDKAKATTPTASTPTITTPSGTTAPRGRGRPPKNKNLIAALPPPGPPDLTISSPEIKDEMVSPPSITTTIISDEKNKLESSPSNTTLIAIKSEPAAGVSQKGPGRRRGANSSSTTSPKNDIISDSSPPDKKSKMENVGLDKKTLETKITKMFLSNSGDEGDASVKLKTIITNNNEIEDMVIDEALPKAKATKPEITPPTPTRRPGRPPKKKPETTQHITPIKIKEKVTVSAEKPSSEEPLSSPLTTSKVNNFVACQCTVNSYEGQEIELESKEENGDNLGMFCQAIDQFEDRKIGCCRIVSSSEYNFHRASQSTQYKLYCSFHFQRLRMHHCCPLCGLYCSQGEAMLCTGTNENKNTPIASHLFHKNCAVDQVKIAIFPINNSDQQKSSEEEQIIGLISKIVCPHCGSNSDLKEISLKFQTNKPKVFVPEREPYMRKIAAATFSMPQKSILNANERLLQRIEESFVDEIDISLEKAKEYLKENPNPNEDFFIKAFEKAEMDKVMVLLLIGKDLNEPFECNKLLPLNLAINCKSIAIIHWLINSGADPNKTDSEGKFPLISAYNRDQTSIILYLIAAGADKFKKSPEGMNILHYAIKEGKIDTISRLLQNHYDLLDTETDAGYSPLIIAAKFKQTNVAREILKYKNYAKKSLIGSFDRRNNSALHWSAKEGCMDLISMLIENEADVNVQNEDGETALHLAIKNGHDGCILILLLKGADPKIQDLKDQNCLELCKLMELSDETKKRRYQSIYAILEQTLMLREHYDKMKKEIPTKMRILSNDISNGKEPSVNIECINNIDKDDEEEPIDFPRDFIYITSSIYTNPSIQPIRSIANMHKCVCQNGTCYLSANCSCSIFNDYDENGRLKNLVSCSIKGENLLPILIRECNQLCNCNPRKCLNRVLQKGIQKVLQVFRHPKEELKWGVKAKEFIPSGSFICEIVGQVYTSIEYNSKVKKGSFAFKLSDNENNHCSIIIDGHKTGNISSFINSNCNPNTIAAKVLIEHEDEQFPHVALFSTRDIEADEEISLDYGSSFWKKYTSKKKDENEEVLRNGEENDNKNYFPCLCNSSSCIYSK